jgi:hypothetical protein
VAPGQEPDDQLIDDLAGGGEKADHAADVLLERYGSATLYIMVEGVLDAARTKQAFAFYRRTRKRFAPEDIDDIRTISIGEALTEVMPADPRTGRPLGPSSVLTMLDKEGRLLLALAVVASRTSKPYGVNFQDERAAVRDILALLKDPTDRLNSWFPVLRDRKAMQDDDERLVAARKLLTFKTGTDSQPQPQMPTGTPMDANEMNAATYVPIGEIVKVVQVLRTYENLVRYTGAEVQTQFPAISLAEARNLVSYAKYKLGMSRGPFDRMAVYNQN